MDILDTYSLSSLTWVACSLLLLGMSKGGFPVGSIAMPLLILAWPSRVDAARASVAFLLPLLCVMDVFAIAIYRRHIDWHLVRLLLPGTLTGVAMATALFISDNHSLVTVTDAALRIAIGTIGLLFVAWHAARKRLVDKLSRTPPPGRAVSFACGITAGITSSLAHAAGPVLQMVLLPQKLPRMKFAATSAAYFFLLNLLKMLPFALLGRIQTGNLHLGLLMLPVIPFGVLLGYGLVRITRDHHYIGFIYMVLGVTSVFLIINGIRA